MFEVGAGVTAAIDGLTIQHGQATWGGGIFNAGNLTVTASTFDGNSAEDAGGALWNGNVLTVTDSTFDDNSAARFGAGVYSEGPLFIAGSTFSGNRAGQGGAIFVGWDPTLTITSSVFSGNTSVYSGGAIQYQPQAPLLNGTLTITNSVFTDNSAVGGGGGAIVSVFASSHASITSSVLIGNNTGVQGGGILNGGALTITDTTISDSNAVYGGGGILNGGVLTIVRSTLSGNHDDGAGGGIYNYGALTIVSSTISGNSANYSGGGISTDAGPTVVVNSTIYGNSASYGGGIIIGIPEPVVTATIMADNPGGNCRGPVVSGGRNLSSDDTCFTGGGTDLVHTDPLLGPLADNGGPTLTHLPQAESPTIDAGGLACPITDQRGVGRPQRAACDIGAVEVEDATDNTPPTLAPAVTPHPVLLGGSATANANASDASSGVATQGCDAVDTSSVGAKTVTCTATDNAGNTASALARYNVVYVFSGFFDPVGDEALNVARAGRAIPLKFRLTDAHGAPATTLTTATVISVNLDCGNSGNFGEPINEPAAGASGLQHLGDGRYQINWKSSSSYAGTCRELRLNLGEGSDVSPVYHAAGFQFIK